MASFVVLPPQLFNSCMTRASKDNSLFRAARKLLDRPAGTRYSTFVCSSCRFGQCRRNNGPCHSARLVIAGMGPVGRRVQPFHSSRWLSQTDRRTDDKEHTQQRRDPVQSDSSEKGTLLEEVSLSDREVPNKVSNSRSPSSSHDVAGPPSANHSPFALRIQHISNQIIDSLTRIAHQLNMYTGTDYTPIQSLRGSIKLQESSLRSRHNDVSSAKTTHGQELDVQRSHQKEVVQLLERKHSWSDADMERYMGLIRGEHVNERAVENAQRGVIQAERALEEARQELERSERKMYHEEQVWSDTIRRNSTWITFGLMGLNVVLLMTQIVAVEPWRRKRLINEMRNALDEKTAVAPLTKTTAEVDASTKEQPSIEAEIDEIIPESTEPSLETLDAANTVPSPTEEGTIEQEGDWIMSTSVPAEAFAHLPPHPFSNMDAFISRESWAGILERGKILIRDLFSNRHIILRKVDLTAGRLEAAGLGVLLGGLATLLGALVLDE